jgi:hypothetical protein
MKKIKKPKPPAKPQQPSKNIQRRINIASYSGSSYNLGTIVNAVKQFELNNNLTVSLNDVEIIAEEYYDQGYGDEDTCYYIDHADVFINYTLTKEDFESEQEKYKQDLKNYKEQHKQYLKDLTDYNKYKSEKDLEKKLKKIKKLEDELNNLKAT